MRELLAGLVALSAIGAVALFISPDGSIKKYVSLSLTLCTLAFVSGFFMRFSGFDVKLPDLPESEDVSAIAANMVIEGTRKNIEDSVIELASSRYNIAREDITVNAALDTSDTENITLERIEISIVGLEYSVIVTDLKKAVIDTYGCECETELK